MRNRFVFSKIFFVFSLTIAAKASADELSFPAVWKQVQEKSPIQEAARSQVELSREEVSRADRHWLPRVYLDMRAFRTNDPGQSFFGLLEQRKVTSADFDPNALNHPEAETYSRGALGLDLALYEGGMKESQRRMYKHASKASELAYSQTQLDQYAQTGEIYGSILVLQQKIEQVNRLQSEVQALMKKYQLGQKSNPVGYSGLLGMKSLANRLVGLATQYDAQRKSLYTALEEMGVSQKSWLTQSQDVRQFIQKYFQVREPAADQASYALSATREKVNAGKEATGMEKSRFLPRVGLFAEEYVFNGNRDTSNGYTGGVYLQWSLFDPSDYGRYHESQLKALSGEKQAEALLQQEQIEKASLEESVKSLLANLDLTMESDKLLDEQAHVSMTLFRNGSISALQFVEILNRRTDLLVQKNEIEMSLIKAATTKMTKYQTQIPTLAEAEGAR